MTSVVIRRDGSTASLMSHVTTVLAMTYAAHLQGRAVYIDLTRPWCPQPYHDDKAFSCEPNAWNWYFEQPNGFETAPADAEIWRWPHENRDAAFYFSALDALPLPARKAYWQATLRPSIMAQALLGRELAKFDPTKTIGVAHRGTDRWTDGCAAPIEEFFLVIDRLLAEHPEFGLLAKPDEHNTLIKLLGRYNGVYSPDFHYGRDLRMSDWTSPVSGYERGMEAVLLMLMFSRCRNLVRNRSSLGWVAALMNQSENIVVGSL